MLERSRGTLRDRFFGAGYTGSELLLQDVFLNLWRTRKSGGADEDACGIVWLNRNARAKLEQRDDAPTADLHLEEIRGDRGNAADPLIGVEKQLSPARKALRFKAQE